MLEHTLQNTCCAHFSLQAMQDKFNICCMLDPFLRYVQDKWYPLHDIIAQILWEAGLADGDDSRL
jgi:hypothetical protein